MQRDVTHKTRWFGFRLPTLVALWIVLSTSIPWAQGVSEPWRVDAVATVGMTVADMQRAVLFYTRVLAFEVVSDVDVAGDAYEHLQGLSGLHMRVVHLKLGDETIVLTEYLTPKGRPAPVDARSHDHWFQHIAIIVSDMDRAYQWLRRHQVEPISSAPQRLPNWNPKAAGIWAFYFKDPDGHPLEILQFPPGKGDAKWHRPTQQLFLGIDHTAIVVRDTAASLTFYRDTLGLKVVGESENYGTEQEHLNNVIGARLRITTLRAASGPGIEFLEYLTPRDGRPLPVDARPSDLVHWQTTLVSTRLDSVWRGLSRRVTTPVSTGVITLPSPALGFTKGLLLRDPDGHAVQLVETGGLAPGVSRRR